MNQWEHAHRVCAAHYTTDAKKYDKEKRSAEEKDTWTKWHTRRWHI